MKINNLFLSTLFVLIGCCACTSGTDQTKADGTASLPRQKTPVYIEAAADSLWKQAAADSLEIHSLMIVSNGDVIYEDWRNGGDASKKHVLNSVSKTFTSIAVGMAVSEGKLKLDEKVVDIFPEYLPETVSENLKAMEVKDLLTMTCGQASDQTFEWQRLAESDSTFNWVSQFLSYPVDYRPGIIYCYNSVGTLMLSAIVQKRAGQKLIDYLTPRLFEPLGIEDPCWEETKDGICYGGWGLYLKTEDLAKAGQLLLQKGKWNGQQVIPETWVAEMTRMQTESAPAGINLIQLAEDSTREIDPDWIQGYGYQMWMCRNGAFRADGARGQFIIVLPGQNSVVVMTADTSRMQKELDYVWRYILPALNKYNN